MCAIYEMTLVAHVLHKLCNHRLSFWVPLSIMSKCHLFRALANLSLLYRLTVRNSPNRVGIPTLKGNHYLVHLGLK